MTHNMHRNEQHQTTMMNVYSMHIIEAQGHGTYCLYVMHLKTINNLTRLLQQP